MIKVKIQNIKKAKQNTKFVVYPFTIKNGRIIITGNIKIDFIKEDIKIKIELIKYAKLNNIKLISCLGTGRKLNASYLEITSLNKTFNDPLAKKIRSELRKENIDLNIPVVFSKEDTIKTENMIGSCVFVPAVAGIYLANYVFLDIMKTSI